MKIINFISLLLLISILLIAVQPVEVQAIKLSIGEDGLVTSDNVKKEDATRSWNELLLAYKDFVLGFFGIATISTVLLFIFSFIKLGASVGNPKERATASTGVLWTGIATALLGGTLFFFGMFYNMLN